MKAAVYAKYGPPEVLQVQEIPTPTPRANEVLVKIHASSVTLYDCWMRAGIAPPGFGLMMRLSSGFSKPKLPILGTEFSGTIEEMGKDVETSLRPQDKVFGFVGATLSAYAEYICVPQEAIALRPENLTDAEAGVVLQGALTALDFLRHGNLQSGQHILVFGASGGVGSFAVQLARYFGARVTGICSTAKMDYVKQLGAEKVIDYTKNDFTKQYETYDFILDTIGKSPISKGRKALTGGGSYVFTTFGLPKLLQMLWLQMTSNKRLYYGMLQEKNEDLVLLKELFESGQLKVTMDKSFPLKQIAEAHRYVESGHKKGQVAVVI